MKGFQNTELCVRNSVCVCVFHSSAVSAYVLIPVLSEADTLTES